MASVFGLIRGAFQFSFLNDYRPRQVFSLEHYCWPSQGFFFGTYFHKPCIQHLVQLCKFSPIQCMSLQKSFQTSLNAIKDHKWTCCFFVSLIVDIPTLYVVVITRQLLLLSSLKIISSFCGIINVACFLFPAARWLLILWFWKP